MLRMLQFAPHSNLETHRYDLIWTPLHYPKCPYDRNNSLLELEFLNFLPEYGFGFGRLNRFRRRRKLPLSNMPSAAGSIVQ